MTGDSLGNIKIWDDSGSVIQTMTGNSPVWCLDELTNGHLLSGTSLGTLVVWNMTNGAKVLTINAHTSVVYGQKQINEDTIVSASGDTFIRLWNLSTGANIRTYQSDTAVFSLTVLKNGTLATGDAGLKYHVKIWDAQNTKPVNVLAGHTKQINTLELIGDDDQLASGSSDGTILLWNLANGRKVNTLAIGSPVWFIRRLDSTSLAAGCGDANIYIWNTTAGTLIRTLKGHSATVESLDLFSDQVLMSGSADYTIRFWNILNGSLLHSLTNNGINFFILKLMFSRE